jgi:phosphoribosylformimino-5-aminoimidazole carboxamide ribotide isomerase
VIAYAAIDLRGGRVVQLVGGQTEHERVSLPDPAAVARQWEQAGFAALHVVDLDAALGIGSNIDAIEEILEIVNVPVQVGGGARDDAMVDRLFALGADRVIVGTRAIEDVAWRSHIAHKYPRRIVVAADVRDGSVMTRGWQTATSQHIDSFIDELNPDALAAVLVTDVSREGQMSGVDAELFARVVRNCDHPVIAAGGIRDDADLKTLSDAGAAGAVLGMALYQGAIDMSAIVPEYVV